MSGADFLFVADGREKVSRRNNKSVKRKARGRRRPKLVAKVINLFDSFLRCCNSFIIIWLFFFYGVAGQYKCILPPMRPEFPISMLPIRATLTGKVVH